MHLATAHPPLRALGTWLLASMLTVAAEKPNIVLIYADDIGYGDFGCYGAKTIPTPHVDALAANGVRFTSGYASAATCTPSRYSLLTGEYAFRQKGVKILPGDAQALIAPGRTTLASILHDQGYYTGIVGKWHLGLGKGTIDWNGSIDATPLDVGFDESFIMAATGDRVPCVFIDGRKVAGLDPKDPIEVSYKAPFPGLPTGVNNRESLRLDWSHGHNEAVINEVGRIGYMKGGKSALWKDETMMDTFTDRALKFMASAQAAKKPFFLYYATHDNHVPRLPNPRHAGKTPHGPRGDSVVEFDDAVAKIIAYLDEHGLRDNTMVVISSDNGPVLDDGYKDQANELLGDHKPAGPLRGGKYSSYEGGTRVPWIVNWPGKIVPGTSDAIICQIDLSATLAALTGRELKAGEATDSINLLPALLGQSKQGREELIEEARGLSLRSGNWKFIAPGTTTSDGLGPCKIGTAKPPGLLFNLATDISESTDVANQNPEVVKTLAARLKTIEKTGHSNP